MPAAESLQPRFPLRVYSVGFARTLAALIAGIAWWSAADPAQAIPAFARQYGMTCAVCHAAYPRLNSFGEVFVANNYRLPNWKEKNIVQTGDEKLMLPAIPPVAFRAQAFVQQREAGEVDPVEGPTGNDAKTDIQAPYLVKILSSAPLSDDITYYFYGIFAEKGGNGETVIEDAWFQHGDLFGSGVSLMLGQFQVSDLMFPREQRLTFQDFMVYRLAGLTYDRGILLGRDLGPIALNLGFVNGNGIDQNFDLNSPGYRRPDAMFDNDSGKSVFGRIGAELGPAGIGLFAYSGMQRNATGEAGTESGDRDTVKQSAGLDISGNFAGSVYWFAQAIQSTWKSFLDDREDVTWSGGFAGVDWIATEEWVLSLLYNYADAGDLSGSGTVYEGIDMNTVTLGLSYYFMRNVKGVIEVNADLLAEDDDADFVGHESQEHYLLFGFDAAY